MVKISKNYRGSLLGLLILGEKLLGWQKGSAAVDLVREQLSNTEKDIVAEANYPDLKAALEEVLIQCNDGEQSAEEKESIVETLATLFGKRLAASEQLSLFDLQRIRKALLREDELDRILPSINNAGPGCGSCGKRLSEGEVLTFGRTFDADGNRVFKFFCAACKLPQYVGCNYSKCEEINRLSSVLLRRLRFNCGHHGKKNKAATKAAPTGDDSTTLTVDVGDWFIAQGLPARRNR